MHNEDRGSSNATVLPQQGAKPRAQKTKNGVHGVQWAPKMGKRPRVNFWILPQNVVKMEKIFGFCRDAAKLKKKREGGEYGLGRDMSVST